MQILSLPVRGAWIEMIAATINSLRLLSLPVRGAWIEIRTEFERMFIIHVAPCEGSVD